MKVFREMGNIAANVEALLKFTLIDGLFKFENKFASVFSQTNHALFGVKSQILNSDFGVNQSVPQMETNLYKSEHQRITELSTFEKLQKSERMTISWGDVGLVK